MYLLYYYVLLFFIIIIIIIVEEGDEAAVCLGGHIIIRSQMYSIAHRRYRCSLLSIQLIHQYA